MRKNIICFIDDLCLGGAQRQLVGLAKLLMQRGYNVRLCTYHNDGFYVDAVKDLDICYDYENKMESAFKRIPEFIRYLKRISPDVIISYIESPCIISCISKIIYPHFKLIVSERNTSQQNGLRETLRFNLYRVADYIVPNSYSQEQFIRDNYHFLSEKVITITNFVDTDKFIPGDGNIDKTIISVGRITPQKNILNYIKAVRRIKDWGLNIRFQWYGDTDNVVYQEECIELLKNLHLMDCFTFLPATKDILSVYQTAFALCLPSTYEGFPNVVCEAMSCGLPILCGAVCDNPSIVSEKENGFLFKPESIESITKSIESLCLLDEDNLKRIRTNNREKAVREFSKNNFIEKYIQLIEK